MSAPGQAELGSVGPATRSAAHPSPAGVQPFTLSPRGIVRLLAGITAVLVVINVLTRLATLHFSDFTGRDWLTIMFGLGGEANIPATFSGGLLLLSGLLLGAIALARRRFGGPFWPHWAVLSATFLFLSLDELASIHDNISLPLSRLHHSSGALLYLWVVPYGVAALALLLGSIRFLLHLPAPTRRLFILAGAVYVGGALGMELLEAASNSRHIATGFIPVWGVIVEETMEMCGTVIFISALLSYLQRVLPGFALQLSVGPETREAGPV